MDKSNDPFEKYHLLSKDTHIYVESKYTTSNCIICKKQIKIKDPITRPKTIKKNGQWAHIDCEDRFI